MSAAHDNDEIRELLLPYSLGELDQVEQLRVQQALKADPALRRELEEIESVGARLAQALPRVPAPPALRARVLDAVLAGEQRERTADADAAVEQATVAEMPVPASLDGARRARIERRRPRFVIPALAGGLVAACVVLGIVAFNLSDDLDATRAKVERLERVNRERPGAPAGFEGAESMPVSTHGKLESASGSLVRVSKDRWILLINGIPTPGVGNSWQVWTQDSRGQIRNVDQWDAGEATGLIVLDNPDIKRVMVSFETTTRPVPTPHGEPVADVRV